MAKMTQRNNTNPYKSPDSEEPAETRIPGVGRREDAIVSGTLVGLLFGCCIASLGSYCAMPIIRTYPNLTWFFEAIWIVSAIIGLTIGIHVGRTKHRAVQKCSERRRQQTDEKHQT